MKSFFPYIADVPEKTQGAENHPAMGRHGNIAPWRGAVIIKYKFFGITIIAFRLGLRQIRKLMDPVAVAEPPPNPAELIAHAAHINGGKINAPHIVLRNRELTAMAPVMLAGNLLVFKPEVIEGYGINGQVQLRQPGNKGLKVSAVMV